MSHRGNILNLEAARDQHTRAAHTGASAGIRWAPLVGGGLLAGYGLARRTPAGLLAALAGGAIAYYGYTGRWLIGEPAPAPDGVSSVRVEESITIHRAPAEIYAAWHDITQLPRIMSHLVSVEETSDGHSRWVARGPAGHTFAWDAEVFHDRVDHVIAWRSVSDTDVPNTGSVRFDEASGGRGTELKVTLEYNPPGGAFGAAIARLLGDEPGQHIADDLRRFKQYIETGERPPATGQHSHAAASAPKPWTVDASDSRA